MIRTNVDFGSIDRNAFDEESVKKGSTYPHQIPWSASVQGVHSSNEIMTFYESHKEWILRTLDEDEVLIALPKAAFTRLDRILAQKQATLAAEKALSGLCEQRRAIGLYGVNPLSYRWLNPSPRNLDSFRRSDLFDDEMINAVNAAINSHSLFKDLDERMLSIAGRLVSSPAFNAQRDELREAWRALNEDERPHLPLRSPYEVANLPSDLERVAVSGAVAQFWDSYRQFCKDWELSGMVSWDLPDPRGPQWSSPDSPNSTSVTMTTPTAFPIKKGDDLGREVMRNHEDRAQRRGIDDDLSKFESYASIFKCVFWRDLLRRRFALDVTTTNGLVGDIVGLDAERIKRLFKWHKGLLAESKKSLTGLR